MQRTLQHSIDQLSGASRSWYLRVNPEKCVAMRFGNQHCMGEGAVYNIEGREIRFVNSYRYLGVVVDVGLKFHLNVDVVDMKAGALLGTYLEVLGAEPGLLCWLYLSPSSGQY